jgi:hypothetical protein
MIEINDTDPDNIFINLTLYNSTDTHIPATIDIGLEKPVLKNASDYKLSIVRFECPLYDVLPSYDLTSLTLKGGIFYNGNSYLVTYSGPVYNNTINDFVAILNNIMSQSYSIFLSANPSFPANTPPYFFYEPRDRLFRLVVQKQVAQANNLYILIHQDIFVYISSFPYLNTSPISDCFAFNIIQLDNNIYNSPIYPSTNNSAFIQYQEYPTDSVFNSLQSVIITSNLPVRFEFLPQPTAQSVQTFNNLSYISSFPILTDFLVPVNRFGDQFSTLYYLPTAEFRWADFIYNQAIDRLSFTFYYQNKNQQTYPLLLHPRTTASIKLYLKHKKLFYK